jgi:hypothetical protein
LQSAVLTSRHLRPLSNRHDRPGDIAQKAYLPVLTARADVELHLLTRDRAKLDRIGDAYRTPHRYTNLEALLDAGVKAAFVHAATSAHLALVERLLEAGRHVYVDKPLDAGYAGAERLVRLAQRRKRSLMIGFNRRYAPDYAALRRLSRDLIVMEKHRADLPAAPRSVIFDDFIHVVDTLGFWPRARSSTPRSGCLSMTACSTTSCSSWPERGSPPLGSCIGWVGWPGAARSWATVADAGSSTLPRSSVTGTGTGLP